MRDKFYRVTKKGGLTYWNFDINADTMKQAKALAKERWSEGCFGHMFQIEAERITEDRMLHCGQFRMIC